jgi:hypothetical protein
VVEWIGVFDCIGLIVWVDLILIDWIDWDWIGLIDLIDWLVGLIGLI